MGYKKPSFIEGIAEKLGIIPNLHKEGYQEFENDMRHFTDEEGPQNICIGLKGHAEHPVNGQH